MTQSATPKNRLSRETSPYLLQHDGNPVDWYPWGADAFEKARNENKPVFLSIGYSTCHWCHVMAHESFENADVAGVLNEYFVSVKVDREERPDVDRLYMAFVQASTGHGGWPMSVWLTPDAKPFYGGTYFPPTDRHGRPGFVTVLERVAELWAIQRDGLLKQASEVVQALSASNEAAKSGAVPGVDALDNAAAAFTKTFDPVSGGFGGAPKFPRPSVFNFLLRHACRRGLSADSETLNAALHTLRRMDAGGMHDHLGGGFHRYSVDEFWHVPHFEKMLYDQAQLVSAYLDAWLISKDPAFLVPMRDTLDYVLRDLTHPDGGIFSAEDADSLVDAGGAAHAEGAFYVWSAADVRAALSSEVADVACRHWGVEEGGNAPAQSDPSGEFAGKNILIRREPIAETARAFGLTTEAAASILEAARVKLFELREHRPRPHRDDKILTAWNGLMISAFARAGAALGEERYLVAARRVADFLKTSLFDTESGELFRTSRADIRGGIRAFAEDYAFLIQGLLDLHEAASDPDDLRWAVELQIKQDTLFADASGTGYFTSAIDEPLLPVRTKEDYDGAEPSASAVSAMNLVRLSRLLQDDVMVARAAGIFGGFGKLIEEMPTAVPQMLAALELYHRAVNQSAADREPAERIVLSAIVPDVNGTSPRI